MADHPRVADQRPYLDLLSHLSRLIGQTPDFPSLVRSSVHVIKAVLEVECCSIMLLDDQGKELTLASSSTIPEEEWPSIRLAVGQGIAGRVAASGEAVRVSAGSGGQGDGVEQSGRYQTGSFLCVPLETTKATIGVVNVTDRQDGADLTQFDEEMLVAMAKMIACAIDNHRLLRSARESHEDLARVVDGLPVGMFTISSAGALSLCNRSAHQYLGMSSGIKLGGPWRQYFPEFAQSHVAAALQRIAQGEPSVSDEFQVDGGRGGAASRSVRISAVPGGDVPSLEVEHVLFLVEDLHLVQEVESLRRSDQMKSSFLSIVSHELRTPLATIKGAIHLLNQMAPPEMQEKAESVFALLHRNSDRLTRLVNNILDAIDIESDMLRLYRKRTDVHALVDQIVSRFFKSEQDKGVDWEVSLDAPHSELYVDGSRFGQVVEHLVENATKFVPPGGKIRVATRAHEGGWALEVANTGNVIPIELHERIFTRFFQVDDTLTRDFGGSGLGLYLCREIVRRHGGDVRLDATCRDGACFLVTMPGPGDPE